MLTIGLFAIIKRNYGLIMDADKNPLFALPPAQRFQTMVYLSVRWTAIVCGSLGAWFWYGELLIAHVLFALGALTTGLISFSEGSEDVIGMTFNLRPAAPVRTGEMRLRSASS